MPKTLALAMAGAGLIAALGASGSASAMPVSPSVSRAAVADVVQVRHHVRRHGRTRFVVRPGAAYAYGYPHFYPDYYATSRGFQDPGFALRGNMPGCAVDLGYGRWESCDK